MSEYKDIKKHLGDDIEQNDYALVKLVDKIPKEIYFKPLQLTIYCHKCLLDNSS
jgi:hypothetical protein